MTETRKFKHSTAVLSKVPLFVGLVGASGSGKTYSALVLATGMQRITGGKIFVIDTESNRARQYAPTPGAKAEPSKGTFDFEHVSFTPPHGPDDYIAVWQHCIDAGAAVIIVDSMSHEHEGTGGVLEMHEAELVKMAGNDYDKRKRVQGFAWGPPKRARRRLLNALTSWTGCAILCWRGKEKLDWGTKDPKTGQPRELGWMQIGAQDFVWEMTINAIFTPGCKGTPDWQLSRHGEDKLKKIPKFFEELFAQKAQLTEQHGYSMAQWANGGPRKAKPPTFAPKSSLEWDGADEWAGKPLVDAPGNVLSAYGAALEMSLADETDSKRKKRMTSALDAVRKVVNS